MALVRNLFFPIVGLSALMACKTAEAPPGVSERAPAQAQSQPAAQDKRPLIVAFGDSLSEGFGAPPGKSYPDYLQKLIDQAQKGYRVYNAGVSGDTTTDGVERLPGILALKPKIAIVELGGNDGLRGIRPQVIHANLDQIVTTLQGIGAQVILAGMTLPRNYGPEYLRSFEQIYAELAGEHHLTRIPFLLIGVATEPTLMQRDSIHPTAEGNKKVAETVFKYLRPLL